MREEELPVILPVHGLSTSRLLVLCVNLPWQGDGLTMSKMATINFYQELVVHRLHHDLLRSVLTHVEPQLQFLTAGVVVVLDERRLEALEPGRVSWSTKVSCGELNYLILTSHGSRHAG